MTIPSAPSAAAAVEPRPAASLILLRDGADGLEVFMIERHRNLAFAPGATVFPGGRLEAADHAPHWRAVWSAGAAVAVPDDLPRRIAAIREAFEECGLLLARQSIDGPADGPAVESRLSALRAAMAAGSPFAEALQAAGLAAAPEATVPLSHWVTPEPRPRRFNTLFFLAAAPPGQEPVVDGGEAVAGGWGTPGGFLAAAGAGRCRLVFVTWMILRRLARCATLAEAFADAGRHALQPILPRLIETPAGSVWRIPAGCGYDPTDTPVEKVAIG